MNFHTERKFPGEEIRSARFSQEVGGGWITQGKPRGGPGHLVGQKPELVDFRAAGTERELKA